MGHPAWVCVCHMLPCFVDICKCPSPHLAQQNGQENILYFVLFVWFVLIQYSRVVNGLFLNKWMEYSSVDGVWAHFQHAPPPHILFVNSANGNIFVWVHHGPSPLGLHLLGHG